MMRSLQYAVRFPLVLKYFGQLFIVLACLSAVPLAVSLLFGDYGVAGRYAAVLVPLLCVGFLLGRIQTTGRMQTNEAMVITAAIFLVAPIVLTWPLMASGLSFMDGLFEAVSGVTTTGLSTVDGLKGRPATFLFSRAWMQWVGGLGITVLSVAAMIRPGLAAKRLNLMEDYDSDLVGSTRSNARHILVVYTVLTLLGIAALALSGTDWLESVLYAFAAISTGGFSPNDGILPGLGNTYAKIILTLISTAGGVSMVLYFKAYKKGWKTFFSDSQTRVFLSISALMTLLTSFFLWYGDGFGIVKALGHGAFSVFSAQSTTGFSSLDMATLGNGSKLSLIFAMIVGGNIGSTAGGIKIFRLMVMFHVLALVVKHSGAPPNAYLETRVAERRLEVDEIRTVLCIIGGFAGFIALSWLPFVACGYPPLDSFFEVVSAVCTVGLSTGITDVHLPPLLKGVLCFDMLLGRLEILPWLVVLYPGTWFGLRRET